MTGSLASASRAVSSCSWAVAIAVAMGACHISHRGAPSLAGAVCSVAGEVHGLLLMCIFPGMHMKLWPSIRALGYKIKEGLSGPSTARPGVLISVIMSTKRTLSNIEVIWVNRGEGWVRLNKGTKTATA